MSSIAIITARGGSKRIPGKNIKEFCGKPIIAYSIKAALLSRLFDEVMVSTDDPKIAEIAQQYGAKVPFYRSEANADDYAGTADVLVEVVNEYKKRGQSYDWLCCIYPTAPFITVNKLQECEERFRAEKAEILIPVVKFSYPPQRAFVMNRASRLSYKWPENINKRSQDLESLYHDAGQFYFVRVNALLKKNTLALDNMVPYIVDELTVQDIDNMEDWKIAEIKYEIILKEKGAVDGI